MSSLDTLKGRLFGQWSKKKWVFFIREQKTQPPPESQRADKEETLFYGLGVRQIDFNHDGLMSPVLLMNDD